MRTRALLPALAMVAAARAETWKTFTYDASTKYTGTAVAAGKEGSFFLVGVDGNKYVTKYVSYRSGKWAKSDVGFTTDQVDIAVDPATNNLHMISIQAVRDKSNPEDLTYGFDDGTGLKQTVLDDKGFYYWVPSLAVDKDGRPHVSSYLKFYPNGDPARDLLYYYQDADKKWHGADLDTSGNETAKFSGIGIDSKGHAHIAYIDVSNGRLHSTHETDSGWVYGDIGSGNWTRKGNFVRTLIDSKDVPHVVYITEASGSGADTNSVLEVAVPDSAGGWKTTVLDTVGVFSFALRFGAAFDGDGNLCLAYRKNADRGLRFLRLPSDGGAASGQLLDTAGDAGFNASLAKGTDGNLYVSYTDKKGVLKIATTHPSFDPTSSVGRARRGAAKNVSLRRGLPAQGRIVVDLGARAPGEVSLELLDLRGQRVAVLGARETAGRGSLEFAVPASLRKGIYVVAGRWEGSREMLGRVLLGE